MPQLSSLNKNLGWSLYLGLLVTPGAAYKVEVSRNVASTWHIKPNHKPKALEPAKALTEDNFQPFQMKYEFTIAGVVTAPGPGVEISPLLKEAAESQRTTIRPTEQQGDRFSSQSIPQWLVNVIGIEIVLDLAILTTIIRRTLRRWLL